MSETNRGESQTVDVPDQRLNASRLPPLFETALQKYADRTAIRTPETSLTYQELDRRSNAVAHALIESGIDVGDRVGLLMENQAAFAVADLAIVKAGAARLPINDMLTAEEYRTILSDAEAETVVVGESFVETIGDLRAELPGLETVIAAAEAAELPDGITALDAVNGVGKSPPDVDVAPDDIAGQFYTGGTTGKPKGVVHTQRGLAMNLFGHLAEFGITSDDTLLLSTPLSHSAGMFLWSGLLAGATVIIHDEFVPRQLLKAVEEREVTWTFMVPTMIYRLLDCPRLNEHDTDSLSTVLYGAGPMTPARLREGIDALGAVFMQFYGQTEVPNLITTFAKEEHRQSLESDDPRLSSAGSPTLMSDVRIIDIQTDEVVPPGEEGEVLVTAPYVMERYHDRPDATTETLSDGWVHTGDIGRIDEHGYLYLLDRKNDVIITGGMNVYSTEIEEVLDEHPGVKEVAVIGIPHDDWGEQVMAIVIPRDDSVTEAEIRSFADERLSDYKRPKQIEFHETIPKTPYGKMDKKALREPYWEGEERQIR